MTARAVLLAPAILLLASCQPVVPPPSGVEAPLTPLPAGTVPHVVSTGLPVPTWREADGTLRQSLDGEWRFLEDPTGRGDAEGWWTPGWSRSGWRRIQVPGVWNAAFPDLLDYEGTGWYALEFDVAGQPGASELATRMLRLGAVFLESKVWLNGQVLGEHRGGYTPIHVSTAGHLRRTGNVLVVRADNRLGPRTIPVDVPTSPGLHGWWPHGGISRSVTLHALPDPWLFKVEPTFLEGLDLGRIEVTLGVLARAADPDRGIEWRLEAPDGSVRQGRVRLAIPGPGVHAYRFRIETSSTARWSRRDPGNLSRLTLEDPAGGDRLEVRFGRRTTEVAGGELRLNGERDFWYGINRHSDDPGLGSVETPATIRRDLDRIRELGANHVRPGHYAVDPRLLVAFRDAGITILEEVPVYQLFLQQLTDRGLIANARLQLAEMIERDRNNPAIVAWSVGNEFANYLPGADRLIGSLAAEARRLDPSRPVAAIINNVSCMVPVVTVDFALADVDIVGVNQYYGWYVGELPQGGRCLDRLHALYPDKAIVATEFGADALAGKHQTAPPAPEPLDDHSYTEEWQAWYLEQQLLGLFQRPWLSGVMPWVLADFRYEWEPATGKPHPVPKMNLKGLVTHDRGTKKKSFESVRGLYAWHRDR